MLSILVFSSMYSTKTVQLKIEMMFPRSLISPGKPYRSKKISKAGIEIFLRETHSCFENTNVFVGRMFL